MKHRYITLLFLITTLVFSSCTDMLEETPLSSLSADNLFQTAEDANAAVIGTYAHVAKAGSHWNIHTPVYGWGMMGTDIWAKPGSSIQSKFTYYSLTAADGQVKSNWAGLYSVINNANNIIALTPNIDASEEVKNRYMAEGYFLRAFSYMDLVQYFGGVPMRLLPTESIEDALGMAKATEEVTWAQIISDLEFAEQYLPDLSNGGRASKWAAKGLLAKAYLTRGGYPVGNYQDTEWFDKAAKKAYEIINESGRTLIQTTPGSDGAFLEYGKQFLVSGENSTESLFEIQYQESDYGAGWGYRSIKGKKTWDNTNYGNYYAMWGGTAIGSDFALSFNDADIRFQWSIGPISMIPKTGARKGEPLTSWMPYKFRWESIPGNAWGSSINAIVLRLADVYLIFAEASNEATGGPNNTTYGMSAYDAINMVRDRAQVITMDDAYLNTESPYGSADLMYGQSFASFDKTNANYDGRHVYYTGSLQERFRAAVLMERAWELCYERHRWFDLKRTGKLIEFARGTMLAAGGKLSATAVVDPIDKSEWLNAGNIPKKGTKAWGPWAIQDYSIYMPIPDVEIEVNPELSQTDQNPGY